MKAIFLTLGLALALLLAQPGRGMAQADPLNPVPGGATAESVHCLQVGDLNSGAFLGTLWKSDRGGWMEKLIAEPAASKFIEVSRDDDKVELFDKDRRLSLQLGFERRKVRVARTSPGTGWKDLYFILSATDQESSTDCIALGAKASTTPGANASKRDNGKTVIFITVRPGTPVNVKPGTKLTATSGPPCPGQPGFFLCPNKFSCAPDGGVCCPGAGSCAGGTFCDRFVANSCIAPSDPSFCQGTGNPATGISLHCAPGSTCLPGNFCVP